jgi:colicin import membrane protein
MGRKDSKELRKQKQLEAEALAISEAATKAANEKTEARKKRQADAAAAAAKKEAAQRASKERRAKAEAKRKAAEEAAQAEREAAEAKRKAAEEAAQAEREAAEAKRKAEETLAETKRAAEIAKKAENEEKIARAIQRDRQARLRKVQVDVQTSSRAFAATTRTPPGATGAYRIDEDNLGRIINEVSPRTSRNDLDELQKQIAEGGAVVSTIVKKVPVIENGRFKQFSDQQVTITSAETRPPLPDAAALSSEEFASVYNFAERTRDHRRHETILSSIFKVLIGEKRFRP